MATETIFLLRFIKEGPHTKFRIFSGPDREHMAYCGYVCMTHEEWNSFRAMFEQKPNVFIRETDNFFADIQNMKQEGFVEGE